MLRRSPTVSLFLLFFLLPWVAKAQQPRFTASDLQADAAVLRSAFEQLHPGLYRYNTRAEADARFDELNKSFDHDQSLGEAFLALSAFSAGIRCGHTYPNFFNQTKATAEALFQGQNRLPFYFRWIDGRMIVLRDFTPTQTLPRGTEVLSIDGVPTRNILARLLTVARADGSNDAKRVAYLQVTGDSNYEAFDVYYPLFYPQAGATRRFEIRRVDHKQQTLVLPTLSFHDRIQPIEAREAARKGGSGVLFDWSYLPSGAALLRMPTWALYDSKWDWKAWLNRNLDDLGDRNAPALIVDLRGNEGGQDIGNEILKRLVTRPTPMSPMRRFVRYRKAPADLNPYLDTWDPSFKDWGAAAVDLPHPWPTAPPVLYFAETRYDDDPAAAGDLIRPDGKPFHGKVFVLIDANNSSATFQFAQVVQQNKLGLLVGQPTGGNQRGINGGAFFFLRLPRTHLEVDLPLIATFPPTPQPDAGLTPDILVAQTISDMVTGKDAELSAVTRQLTQSTPKR